VFCAISPCIRRRFDVSDHQRRQNPTFPAGSEPDLMVRVVPFGIHGNAWEELPPPLLVVETLSPTTRRGWTTIAVVVSLARLINW
jgi:Uma2 family endonuclease